MVPSTYLKLVFECSDVSALYKTEFCHPRLIAPRRCIRGSFSLPVMDYRAFPWTAGVKGLCILLIRHFLYAAEKNDLMNQPRASITGCAGSPAGSLDLAISRQPAWLQDMFGTDSNGACILRHLVSRINPERKRPGPTALSIKPDALPTKHLSIFMGDKPADSAKVLEILEDLENSWTFSRKNPCITREGGFRAGVEDLTT